MEMSGEFRIHAPLQVVWDSLNDPIVLKSCLRGCEKLDKLSDTAFAAILVVKVGPIKTTFAADIKLSDIDPPNAYVISGEGKGGSAGFAKGSAKVRLSNDDGVTVLAYTVDARVGESLVRWARASSIPLPGVWPMISSASWPEPSATLRKQNRRCRRRQVP